MDILKNYVRAVCMEIMQAVETSTDEVLLNRATQAIQTFYVSLFDARQGKWIGYIIHANRLTKTDPRVDVPAGQFKHYLLLITANILRDSVLLDKRRYLFLG